MSRARARYSDLRRAIGVDDERARVGISRPQQLVCPLNAFQDGGIIGNFRPKPGQILLQVTGQPPDVILAEASVRPRLVPIIDLQADENADDDDRQFDENAGPVVLLHVLICLAIEAIGSSMDSRIR